MVKVGKGVFCYWCIKLKSAEKVRQSWLWNHLSDFWQVVFWCHFEQQILEFMSFQVLVYTFILVLTSNPQIKTWTWSVSFSCFVFQLLYAWRRDGFWKNFAVKQLQDKAVDILFLSSTNPIKNQQCLHLSLNTLTSLCCLWHSAQSLFVSLED